jgi:hypothetical protein
MFPWRVPQELEVLRRRHSANVVEGSYNTRQKSDKFLLLGGKATLWEIQP